MRCDNMDENKDAALARRLLRGAATASLATWLPKDAGTPYVSLSTVACDLDATPLLLMSDLAEHSRNVAADSRASLLFCDSGQRQDPLAGPRLTAMGRLVRSFDARQRRRFLARHPAAARYADFGDFALYRLDLKEAHLVAGFGKVAWFDADALLLANGDGLETDEEGLVIELNSGPAAELSDLVGRQPEGEPWQVTGCDTEGIDLRAGGQTARHDFRRPLAGVVAIRRALRRFRKKAGPGSAK
ncbi:MAG: heme iron utilization protein [Rhodospirillaceae bacterium]|jgi:hypothetical protein|nr:heme iron utilization protein [Rhodospirillaceae bacterium]|tara:strand:- start:935 stop:1666 length:732 start_codon:yes stop_codon:yes gene_type:complete